jgi:hypothetical protein
MVRSQFLPVLRGPHRFCSVIYRTRDDKLPEFKDSPEPGEVFFDVCRDIFLEMLASPFFSPTSSVMMAPSP